MGATRPYLLIYKGKKHIIEAANAALAVHHVVGADISELRPARAAEVTQWMRDKNEIPVADGKRTEAVVEPAAAVELPTADEVLEPWTVGDAQNWIAEKLGMSPEASTGPVPPAWQRIVSSKRMTLEDFDVIRTAVPDFGLAIAQRSVGTATTVADVNFIRERLEESPMSLDDVIGNLHEAFNYASENAEDRMVGQTGHLDA